MKRKAVKSSTVTSIGYQARTKCLEIRFCSKGIYQYLNVHPETYKALMQSKSKGSFFMMRIKDKYSFIKVK